MSIYDLINKACDFFSENDQNQATQAEKLKILIDKFEEARVRLKKEYKKEKDKKRKKKILKEYKAVKKLMKKAEQTHAETQPENPPPEGIEA